MRIVVVGGTGLIGAKLVSNLRHRGHDVVSASRQSGVNTVTGEGDLVSASPLPHTILHSTQFYEFMPRIPESDADGRTVRASPALVQPLASAEVAAALADLATAAPRNRMIEFAGPECFRLDEIVQRVMQVTQDSREVITDPGARYFGAPLSEDSLTPDEGAIIGVGSFDDWLKTARSRQPGGATASSFH